MKHLTSQLDTRIKLVSFTIDLFFSSQVHQLWVKTILEWNVFFHLKQVFFIKKTYIFFIIPPKIDWQIMKRLFIIDLLVDWYIILRKYFQNRTQDRGI